MYSTTTHQPNRIKETEQGTTESGMEQYGIQGYKDRALLGLTGEQDTEYYDITQFIYATTYQSSKEGKSSTKKLMQDVMLGLRNISPTAWMGAKAKIPSKLLDEGNLQGVTIYGYLAYTVKISQLAIEHTWQSILKYERMFRMQQAFSNCGWGEDFSYLNSAYLKTKNQGPSSWGGVSGYNNMGSRSKDGARLQDKRDTGRRPPGQGEVEEEDQICFLFNMNKCFFRDCKFRHKCEVCKGEHAAVDCSLMQKNPSKWPQASHFHTPWPLLVYKDFIKQLAYKYKELMLQPSWKMVYLVVKTAYKIITTSILSVSNIDY